MTVATTKILTGSDWQELTANDATLITLQCLSGWPVLIKGAADSTIPSDELGAFEIGPGEGLLNVGFAALFPGMVAVRLFAKGREGVRIVVHHD